MFFDVDGGPASPEHLLVLTVWLARVRLNLNFLQMIWLHGNTFRAWCDRLISDSRRNLRNAGSGQGHILTFSWPVIKYGRVIIKL